DTVLLNDSTRRCNRLLHCGISMRLLAQCKSTCNLRWSLRPRCIGQMMAFTKWGNENRSFQQNQWSEPIKRQRGLGNELIARAIAECKILSRRDRLVGLVARYGLPAVYPQREFVVVGGLMSYAA